MNYELEAPVAGVIESIVAVDGDEIKVGATCWPSIELTNRAAARRRPARGAAAANVADPVVRAPGDGAVRGEADPRLGASVHRHGGDRRRRLRRARKERLHHEHPSRPRPLRRQGARPEADDGRDHRPRGRLLPRPRRQHAHHRDRRGHARRGRDRGGLVRDRRRSRTRPPPAGARRGRRLLLRRRRLEPGHPPRGLQPRRRARRARGLRLREQPVGDLDTRRRLDQDRRTSPTAPRATASPA